MQSYGFFCCDSNNSYSFADLFFGMIKGFPIPAIRLFLDNSRQAMELFRSKSAQYEWSGRQKKAGRSIGFVPTMGALHPGHLELLKQARQENDSLACSIFVNPLQFNKAEDLESYPRSLEKDLALLREAACDAVFCPGQEEMYPSGESHKTFGLGQLAMGMEGAWRPGHFEGVAVVVDKLFRIVQPHRAYFGLKDYQQLQVIRRMAESEGHSVKIVACNTVREADGLAMSSRNVRLNSSQRREASKIFRALNLAREMYPHHPIEEIRQKVCSLVNESKQLEVEYFEIVDAHSLVPLSTAPEGLPARACIAVHAGHVRLIDNMALNA